MKNYWLNKKLSIAVIERTGNKIRFTLSNSHVWKFSQIRAGVLEWCRHYPVLDSTQNYVRELNICREKAWDIFNAGQG